MEGTRNFYTGTDDGSNPEKSSIIDGIEYQGTNSVQRDPLPGARVAPGFFPNDGQLHHAGGVFDFISRERSERLVCRQSSNQ